MTDRYAVIGNPIEHSLSPQIHKLFAEQTQQDISYEKISAEENTISDTVKKFFASGGKGLNITLPFKNLALEVVDEADDIAVKAGAINTIYLKDDRLIGTNTDGIGLVRHLQNHSITLENKKILLLGAGGAACGVIHSLLQQEPSLLHIANRTAETAHNIASNFSTLSSSGLTDISKQSFDVIINATSASLQQQDLALPDYILHPQTCCYDMYYGKTPSLFLQWAQNNGIKQCYDGFGMLIEQAAESFFLWRGVHPDTQAACSSFKSI